MKTNSPSNVLFLFFTLFTTSGFSQNVFFQVYYAGMRTVYRSAIFDNNTNGGLAGVRLAVGADRYQIGVESETALSTPSFVLETEIDKESFLLENTYQGLFLRANFSSIPIYRMGMVAKLGAGFFEDKIIREINDLPDFQLDYPDKIIGINAGLGVSGPIMRWFHWDVMYQVNYHQRPELFFDNMTIDKHNAWQHSFQIGVSINLAFGKAKKRAKELTEGRGW